MNEPKPFLSQIEAAEYLSARLPYPVLQSDVKDWHRNNTLRGEYKPGGKRVYFTTQALDNFVAEDERRRAQEFASRKASAQAAKTRKLRRGSPDISTEDAIAEIRRLTRGS